MKRLCLAPAAALAAALAATPAVAQEPKWHFISIDDSDDPVAWFISDKIEPFDGGRKKVSYALIMREGDEDMYDIPARGWVRYNVVYDCARRQSGLIGIDGMHEDGRVYESEPKELTMREIFDGDDGKYYAFVCENRRNSKVRVSISQLAGSARSQIAKAR